MIGVGRKYRVRILSKPAVMMEMEDDLADLINI